jgi:uncharacterized membrane protein SirB2
MADRDPAETPALVMASGVGLGIVATVGWLIGGVWGVVQMVAMVVVVVVGTWLIQQHRKTRPDPSTRTETPPRDPLLTPVGIAGLLILFATFFVVFWLIATWEESKLFPFAGGFLGGWVAWWGIRRAARAAAKKAEQAKLGQADPKR